MWMQVAAWKTGVGGVGGGGLQQQNVGTSSEGLQDPEDVG